MRAILIAMLFLLVGCSGPRTVTVNEEFIQSRFAVEEQTRDGVEKASTLAESVKTRVDEIDFSIPWQDVAWWKNFGELISIDPAAVREKFVVVPKELISNLKPDTAALHTVVKRLLRFWNTPAVSAETIEEWEEEAIEVQVEQRAVVQEMALFNPEVVKSRAAVGGKLKLGGLVLIVLGAIGVSLYVRFQYGRIAGYAVGLIGGCLAIGYALTVYMDIILIGGFAVGAVAIVVLGFFALRESGFAKRVIASVQEVRETYKGTDVGSSIDTTLSITQDASDKCKIKRLKEQ